MGWLDDLIGQTVGLDTAPLIYFIEANPAYLPIIEPFFEAIDNEEIAVVTSTITLLEVLVNPLRQKKVDLVKSYRDILLNAGGLTTIDLIPEIAEQAAELRARLNLGAPDAIQVATALFMGATTLVTNDKKLVTVPDINVLVLDEL